MHSASAKTSFFKGIPPLMCCGKRRARRERKWKGNWKQAAGAAAQGQSVAIGNGKQNNNDAFLRLL
jgi:hypothetical protein